MGVLDDIMPADKSDAAPITQHLRGLLQELRREGADLPRITIQLDADAWSALELQFRRPFRPHSSYKYLPLDVGVVAFERRREEQETGEAAPQTMETVDRPWPAAEARPLRWWETAEPSPRPPIPIPVQMRQPAWTPERVEAQAASISAGQSADGRRPEDAIYTAPMAGPISEGDGAAKVDVATYGGPWKEPSP